MYSKKEYADENYTAFEIKQFYNRYKHFIQDSWKYINYYTI